MVAALGFDMQTDSEFWIPDWGCEIELDWDVCQEYGIVWLPNLNAVGGGLLFDQKVANHGTLTNGPTWGKGKFGEPAIAFDGTNDYIPLGTSAFTLVNNYTIFTWFRIDGGSSFRALISANATTVFLGINGTPSLYGQSYDIGVRSATGATTLATGTWYHAAFTKSSSNGLVIYLNGVSDGTGSGNSDRVPASPDAVNFGRDDNSGSPTFYWNGAIAMPGWCSKVLSATQILNLYNNPFLPYWQPSSATIFDMRYDPSPYTRTGTDRTVTQVNDHGATAPGPFSWSGGTLGYSMGNYVTGSANNYADTYALKFDNNELLPTSVAITGIEIKVTAYSPAATLDLQTLAYGPYAAIYKNGTYQSSSGAGQYLTTSAVEYTIGGSANTLGVTWAAGDTIDIALWVNLYDNVGTTPNCYITAATMTIWYGSGTSYTVTLSEGIKAGDTFAPVRRLSFSITDGCVASDTLTAALRRAGAITDGAVATDTFVGLLVTTKTLTEGCTLADTFTGARRTTPTITEGCTLSDTHTATLRRTGALTDGAIATDTLTAALRTTPTISDGAVASDTLVGGLRFSKTITDGAVGSDTNTSLIGSLMTLADGAKAGDSLATVLRASGVVAEGCKAGESLVAVGVFGKVLSEGAVGGEVFVESGASIAGSLLFTAYATPSIHSLASLQPSLDADAHLRPSIEGKVS